MHLHRHAEVPIPLSLSLSIYVGMRGGTGGKSAGPGTDLRQWEEEMPPIFFFGTPMFMNLFQIDTCKPIYQCICG